MLKILVLTRNHPVEVIDVMRELYESIGALDNSIFIGSPQFTAYQVSQTKKIPYTDAYYPAIRAYKKIDDFANEDTSAIIVVGAVDRLDIFKYNAVIGLKNKEIKDYTEFPEEFNTTKLTTTVLENSDILFNNIEEVIHFIRIVINNHRRKEQENEQV